MIDYAKNIIHIIRIAIVLRKHNVLFFLENLGVSHAIISFAKIFSSKTTEKRQGERLAEALQELGPTFIKLGQVLSTRCDVMGEKVAEDLAKLQDKLPSFPSKQAHYTIEKEFGCKTEKLFKSFDDKPVAAASIAQVHFAVDMNGNEVAVKILRPKIEVEFARDIRFLYWCAKIIHRTLPKYKRLKLQEVVKTFDDTVKEEMNLLFEASAASELRENFENDDVLEVPKVYWNLTTRRVLTLQRVSGIEVDDIDSLIKAGHDVEELTRKAAEIFFKQVFRDGFFHADMHPGNLFVKADGNIVAMDFGIMGRIDKQTRIFLIEMLHGFLNRDYNKVAEVHFEAGYIHKRHSKEKFAQAARCIGEPIFGLKQGDISMGRLLGQLFQLTEDFEMETQMQLLLLQKTMVQLEGVGRKLNPNANFWEIARPLAEKWLMENFSPKAKAQDVVSELKATVCRVNNFLKATDYLSDIITDEGIKFHPDTTSAYRKRNSGGWKSAFVLGAIFGSIAVYIFCRL